MQKYEAQLNVWTSKFDLCVDVKLLLKQIWNKFSTNFVEFFQHVIFILIISSILLQCEFLFFKDDGYFWWANDQLIN